MLQVPELSLDCRSDAASAWVRRWSHLLAEQARVLDVACGNGRHVRWFAGLGCRVTGVDRDAATVAPLSELADIVVADIEQGPWPFAGRRFDAVVVTNYLWRPRLPDILKCVAPGGVLIYETFSAGNEAVGRPSNPDFLLRRAELLEVCRGQQIVAFEEGIETMPKRCVQRIVAVRPDPTQTPAAQRRSTTLESRPAQLKSGDSEDSE